MPKWCRTPNDPSSSEQPERAGDVRARARTPRPGCPRMRYGAKENANAEPRSRPESRGERRRSTRRRCCRARAARAAASTANAVPSIVSEHALASELAQPEHQQERPREVVLLLDRERPEVLQELRPPGLGDVRAVGDDLPPVARVRQRRDRVGTQRADRVGQEQQRVRDDDREQRVERGQQAPRAAQVELPQRDAARLSPLAQQQRGDEVAADDEEDLDAEEAARSPARLRARRRGSGGRR